MCIVNPNVFEIFINKFSLFKLIFKHIHMLKLILLFFTNKLLNLLMYLVVF